MIPKSGYRFSEKIMHKSIRIFREHGLDRAAPRTVIFLQQLFGRRDAALEVFLDRLEIARLVAAAPVVAVAPRQPAAGDVDASARQLQHGRVADRGVETAARHVITQLLALLRGPAF